MNPALPTSGRSDVVDSMARAHLCHCGRRLATRAFSRRGEVHVLRVCPTHWRETLIAAGVPLSNCGP